MKRRERVVLRRGTFGDNGDRLSYRNRTLQDDRVSQQHARPHLRIQTVPQRATALTRTSSAHGQTFTVHTNHVVANKLHFENVVGALVQLSFLSKHTAIFAKRIRTNTQTRGSRWKKRTAAIYANRKYTDQQMRKWISDIRLDLSDATT